MPDYFTQFGETLDLVSVSGNFTLKEDDRGRTFIISSTVVVTVPRGLKKGLQIRFIIVSGGVLSFIAGSGVTINSVDSQTIYNSVGQIVDLYGYAGNTYMRGMSIGVLPMVLSARCIETTFDGITANLTAVTQFVGVKSGDTFRFDAKIFTTLANVSSGVQWRMGPGSGFSGSYRYSIRRRDTGAFVSQALANIGDNIQIFSGVGETQLNVEMDGQVVATEDGSFVMYAAPVIGIMSQVDIHEQGGFTLLRAS